MRCRPARWERAGRSSPGGSPASFEGEPARRQTSSAASASVIPLRRRRLSICPSGYMNHGSRKGITPTNATTTDITVQKRKNFPRAVSPQPAASKMSPHPPEGQKPSKTRLDERSRIAPQTEGAPHHGAAHAPITTIRKHSEPPVDQRRAPSTRHPTPPNTSLTIIARRYINQ